MQIGKRTEKNTWTESVSIRFCEKYISNKDGIYPEMKGVSGVLDNRHDRTGIETLESGGASGDRPAAKPGERGAEGAGLSTNSSSLLSMIPRNYCVATMKTI